jgi:hypothetical protein
MVARRLSFMGTQAVLFARRYRAALLDYLLGAGEAGLTRAYDLGRGALDDGIGVLFLVQVHQRALRAVVQSARSIGEALGRVEAAELFLTEALSPFELTYRGYLSLVGGTSIRPRKA